MRQVLRSATPTVLATNATAWLAELLAATTKKDRESKASKYRHREIRAALTVMFEGKCAYCESKICHVSYSHIEHYEPRNGSRGNPSRTFDWTNLLLACGVCNGSENKGDKFPLPTEGGPLINPCVDDPSAHFQFVYDANSKLASVYGSSRRGVISELVLGLNRPELRTFRSEYIRKIACLVQLSGTNAEAADLVTLARRPDAQYAAFVNAVF